MALTFKADKSSCFQSAEVRALLHDLCLQIAARNPRLIHTQDVAANLIEDMLKEFRNELDEDPKFVGKSEALKENIIAGRMKKYLSTNCLLNQAFVKDESMSVEVFLDTIRKIAGAELGIVGFLRLGIR